MTAQALHDRSGSEPVFRDPNEAVAQALGIRLLREILEYQQRLTRLLEQDSASRTYLVNAYRKAIRVRREMLRDLPLTEDPVDA